VSNRRVAGEDLRRVYRIWVESTVVVCEAVTT